MSNNNSNRLFEPYKSIGLVSSNVPHLIRYIEKLNKIQIVTAVGRSFLVFNEKLQLIETCVAHDSDITLLASDSKFLFTAASNEIFAWKHGHRWKIKSYKDDLRQNQLHHLMVLGGQLLAIDCNQNLICWDISTQEITAYIAFNSEVTTAEDSTTNSTIITAILHPATYINKILIGTQQGRLQLWNISKQKLIYQYNGFGSEICSLVQSPALHVVAIGHHSGLIVLHQLQQDTMIMKFQQEFGPVTTISFRTNDSSTFALMISGSRRSGHLAIWNLDEQRLEQQMRDLHWQSIASASFIQKQPLMITNSSDNSLKIFIFDDLQTTGRLLFQREGHRAPPTRIRFYGDKGKFILSAGLDSTLRSFSIYSERLNRSLGLASANRKLAKKRGIKNDTNVLLPIVDFAAEPLREKEWDNLVACHRNTSMVTTWSVDRMKMGEHKLLPERFTRSSNNVQAECVYISSCGNFVIIGYNTGHIDRFNIQSGLHRGSYRIDGNDTAHQGPVRSVLSDALNQMIISGGADRYCRLWHFAARNKNQLIGSFKLSDSVARMCLHKDNQFVAIALDDFSVIVMDLDTKKKVRHFRMHRNRITDMTFDNDCRRLFISAMDSFVYIWDMISGQLVDVLATETPCVSLSLSPNGEFIATSHVNQLAIYLWSNISLYSKVTLQPLTESHLDTISLMQMPAIKSDEIDNREDSNDDDDVEKIMAIETNDNDDDDGHNILEYQYKSPEQISNDLITLSSVASYQWKNLLQLDLIRKRNKPKEVLEKPTIAPFFLPCISGLEPKFDLSNNDDGNDDSEMSTTISNEKSMKISNHLITPFAKSLQQHYHENNLLIFFNEKMKSLGPSKIDAEIRSIGSECIGTIDFMLYFLTMIEMMIESNCNFELCNAYIGLFIKCHAETICRQRKLFERIDSISTKIIDKWQRLQRSLDRSISLIEFLRNALI
ncbi:wd repeat-containing protein 36-like protein [Dermatophagoides farinae]|uniref:Wd repeat-containing protein 36-like protein n=1 Tax=Dermatophagoides farinae TaxID=6954 RepID=A0A9D4P801_DERFA|nr:WD repeat-containing protein 36-like [Dermatophagoides farinae]KAH7645319.1 wd repeat-containing protein 36-like protein [Dermatophagoides farinae]